MNFIKKVVIKIQALYFKCILFRNSIFGLPTQTEKEVLLFKKALNVSKSEKLEIFEWGSGFSTTYYAEYLTKKGRDFEWHSIDNNRTWHEKVKSKINKKGLQSFVRLYLKEFPPFWEKPGWSVPPPCGVFVPKSEDEKAYINYPISLNDKFDIVIVDARFRRHCIQTARKVVKQGGIVILHDAQKLHYQIGLDSFEYRTFLDTGSWYPFQELTNKVWIGSLENNEIFEALQSF